MPDIQVLVNELVSKLKKRKVEGSHETARQTAELLRSVISQHKAPPLHTDQAPPPLIEVVKDIGERLIAANPVELAVGNIVRRVLHIIREEDFSLVTNIVGGLRLSGGSESDDEKIVKQDDKREQSAVARSTLHPPSLHTLLESTSDSATACHTSALGIDPEGKGKHDKNSKSWKLKRGIIQAVNDLIEDIDICHDQIAEQAVELIHHNEVILTFGCSRTVMKFLRTAKKKNRSFQVFVAEGAPRYQGHVLAKKLAAAGLQTTVITDSSVFAMISRVHMVVVGVHAVMANGGVIGPVGLNMVALAARRHAVPFVVVAGTHKLCPMYPHNPEVLLNNMRSPSELLPFEEFSDCMDPSFGSGAPLLHVVNPEFDYVPPDLVSLFITDLGGYSPSFMDRLVADYYSADDLILQQKSAA